jgi:hypothetical protein
MSLKPIESAPKREGVRIIIQKDCGPGSQPSFSIGFWLNYPKGWHSDDMDAARTIESYGYRVTHWCDLPDFAEALKATEGKP